MSKTAIKAAIIGLVKLAYASGYITEKARDQIIALLDKLPKAPKAPTSATSKHKA